MNVERLFTDPDFEKLIAWYCSHRGLNVDEMRQEVFAEIIDSGANTIAKCRQIADKVTQQHKRRSDDISLNETIFDEEMDADGAEYRSTDDWYWRGCSPEMNEAVRADSAWI